MVRRPQVEFRVAGWLRLLNLLAACALMGLAGSPTHRAVSAQPAVYDVFKDFSLDRNPSISGTWRYGWTSAIDGSFELGDQQSSYFGGVVRCWTSRSELIIVCQNTSGADYRDAGANVLHPGADYLHIHPSLTGSAVVRWTAPVPGRHRVDFQFRSLREGSRWTTTDVHVLVNGTEVYEANLRGVFSNTGLGRAFDVQLDADDTIDFIVGNYSGDNSNDSTGLKATITPLQGFGPGAVCEGATPLLPGVDVRGRIASATDVALYRFDVAEPFSRVEITVPDPKDQLNLDLYRSCVGDIGIGSGRHIGIGSGRHIGGQKRLLFDTKADVGRYFLAVSAKSVSGEFPIDFIPRLEISTVDPNSIRTLILTDELRLQTLYGLKADAPEMVAWRRSLTKLAATPTFGGLVVYNLEDPAETNTVVRRAYAQWLTDPGSPVLSNAVATAIRDWIWGLRSSLPHLEYVVLAGDDRVIPHQRLPIATGGGDSWRTEGMYLLDDSGINPASAIGRALSGDFTLSDDIYGARQSAVSYAAGVSGVVGEMYIPDLAVGRLVDRPSAMTAAIEAFAGAGGEVALQRSLVAGYGFMQDAAEAADGRLAQAGLAVDSRKQILGDDVTAVAIRDGLFQAQPSVAFLAVHADHYRYELADRQRVTATEVLTRSARTSPALVFALACHAGLNVPGTEHARPTDFPEAWLAHRTGVYVSSTAWAYGMDGTMSYGEALMDNFAEALLAGEQTTAGDALARAKAQYYLDHNDRPMHLKTIAGTVLYGLPMYRVKLPQAPATPRVRHVAAAAPLAPPIGAVAPVASTSDEGEPDDVLVWRDFTPPLELEALKRFTTTEGSYFTYPGHRPLAESAEPFQPVVRYTLGAVDRDGQVLGPRGAVFRGGRIREVLQFDPIVYQASILDPSQKRADNTVPPLAGWYPRVPFALRRLDRGPGATGLAAGRDMAQLVLPVGGYHAESRTQRLLESATFDIYFSASLDRAGASVKLVGSTARGSQQDVTVDATDASGVERITVAYTAAGEPWRSADLTRETSDGSRWVGSVTRGATFVVQVVDAAGNVTVIQADGTIDRPCVGCQPRPTWLYLPWLNKDPRGDFSIVSENR